MKPRGSVYDTSRHIAHRNGGIRQLRWTDMRALTSMILVVLLAAPLAGCFVRTRDRHQHNGNSSARRGGNSCGPAHHWDGNGCVHNGRGPKVRDHRK